MRSMKKENHRFLQLGITIFASLSAVILVYLGFSNIKKVSAYIAIIKSALQPIVIGLILAYLLSPIETKMEQYLIRRKIKNKPAKTIAVFVTTFLTLATIGIGIRMLLPQVIKTIMDLSITLPGMMMSFTQQLKEWVHSDSQIMEFVNECVIRANDWLNEWLKTGIYEAMTSILSGIIDMFGFLFNIIIGFIVMIYVLFEKDKFRGQAKKILYAVSKNRSVNAFILDTIRQCDRMFGGFITGKIIDSLIIGIICFICMHLLKLPYVTLISLIVGITNVIPFFGPYIGAIPSAFLILLVNPMQCIIFIIFIIILQQVDGNIIGPRILGESTGLSPFWVLFAILVAGEVFGVIGMIIGVPLFATVYYVIKRLVESQLSQQDLPIDTEAYISLDKLDEDNQATFLREEKKKVRRKKKESRKEKETE